MKILIVTNFYPPVNFGGYEIGCSQVAQGLQRSGHTICVLTSRDGNDEYSKIENFIIERKFINSFRVDLGTYPKWQLYQRALWQEYHNQTIFRNICHCFQPDIVYFWNLAHITHLLYPICQKYRIKFGIFTFDHSLMEQSLTPWGLICKYAHRSKFKQCLKTLMSFLMKSLGCYVEFKRATPQFIHYPTDYLRSFHLARGIQSYNWIKITWGVDVKKFQFNLMSQVNSKILYVGQISSHKGVHIAIETLAVLYHQYGRHDVTLTLAGKCLSEDYQDELRELIQQYDLGRNVQFLGFVDRDDLPNLYAKHSILIFPSQWEEPMGITVLEAMAIGLVVVSSGRGGSAELTEHNVTGLIFEAGNAEDCASKIMELLNSPDLFQKLRVNARSNTESIFNFENTLNHIESSLLQNFQ